MDQKFEAARETDQLHQNEAYSVDRRDYMAMAQRSVTELDGLKRIADELRMVSMRERVNTQPLREDVEAIISRSQYLIEQSTRLSNFVAANRARLQR